MSLACGTFTAFVEDQDVLGLVLEYLSGFDSLRLLQTNKAVRGAVTAALTKLNLMHLMHNKITDVSPLASLTSLIELDLEENEINDVSPLASLTSLTGLDLEGNYIYDLSPLASLTSLSCDGMISSAWLLDRLYPDA